MALTRWLSCPECSYDHARVYLLDGDRLGAKCGRCGHSEVVATTRLPS